MLFYLTSAPAQSSAQAALHLLLATSPPVGSQAVFVPGSAAWITAAGIPVQPVWQQGTYVLNLVSRTAAAQFSAGLWQADADGNAVTQIGTTQTSQGTASLQFVSQTINPPAGSRLLLTLLVSGVTYAEIDLSQCWLQVPWQSTVQATNLHNTFRRGRFLGRLLRPGEYLEGFDRGGIPLYP